MKTKYYVIIFNDYSTWEGKIYTSKESAINTLLKDYYFNNHYELENYYIYNKNQKVVGAIIELEME